MNTNPKVDAYLIKAQPFARPILIYLRKMVHRACPEIAEEIKWSCPHFTYKGKILCSMAAFKQHCAFGFWLESKMQTMEPYRAKGTQAAGGMGSLGQIKSVKDLPSKKNLLNSIKEAMQLIDSGATLKKTVTKKTFETPVPDALQRALAKNKIAKSNFEKFPPSHRKEYIRWINDAKTDATREKRIAKTIEWVSESKGRNWKYER